MKKVKKVTTNCLEMLTSMKATEPKRFFRLHWFHTIHQLTSFTLQYKNYVHLNFAVFYIDHQQVRTLRSETCFFSHSILTKPPGWAPNFEASFCSGQTVITSSHDALWPKKTFSHKLTLWRSICKTVDTYLCMRHHLRNYTFHCHCTPRKSRIYGFKMPLSSSTPSLCRM